MKSVTKKCKLFVLDPLWNGLVSDKQTRALEQAGYEIIVDTHPRRLDQVPGLLDGDEDRVIAINPDYVGWKVTAAEYRSVPGLKGIFLMSTSFGWIEQDAARATPIFNIRNFSTQSVAEWAVLMMLSLARRVPELIKGGFPEDYERYVGTDLRGKTAAVIGLGHIGTAIAERCQGLGMEVVYWSREARDERFRRVDLADAFQADVVFPAMAENDATRQIITPELIRSMKPSSMFVSVVHKYYDHDLLLGMVSDGRLAGYGFEDAAATFNNYHGNVWAAPAYAWCTDATMQRSVAVCVENLVSFSQGKPINEVS